MPERPLIAAYYLPHYHIGEQRLADRQQLAWSHWRLLRKNRPRFDGHRPVGPPLWGEEDEADPDVMARKIDTAVQYGIDAWLFHWYQHDDGPLFAGALERGFLGARNRERLRYALVWDNRDLLDAYPARGDDLAPVLFPGQVDGDTLEALFDSLIDFHAKQPNYLHVGGAPYFQIADLERFLASCGGMAEAKELLRRMRHEAVEAGLPGLHLAAQADRPISFESVGVVAEPPALVKALGLDSVTSRRWIQHVPFLDFPTDDYRRIATRYLGHLQQALSTFSVPYIPCVSLGWDPTPHCHPDADFIPLGYPFTPVITGNDADAIRQALSSIQFVLDDRPDQPALVCIDSWNDWTHGATLEPDQEHGAQYLQAVRDVFGTAY